MVIKSLSKQNFSGTNPSPNLWSVSTSPTRPSHLPDGLAPLVARRRRLRDLDLPSAAWRLAHDGSRAVVAQQHTGPGERVHNRWVQKHKVTRSLPPPLRVLLWRSPASRQRLKTRTARSGRLQEEEWRRTRRQSHAPPLTCVVLPTEKATPVFSVLQNCRLVAHFNFYSLPFPQFVQIT
jgi:hypothetical protein